MSTEGIVAFATVVHELQWVLIVLGFIALGGLVAGANHRANQAEQRAAELAAENAELRNLLGLDHLPRIVALPPRKGTETSHG